MSSHFFLQDHCKEVHPHVNAEKCAFVYGWFKKYQEYDQIVANREVITERASFKLKDRRPSSYVPPVEEVVPKRTESRYGPNTYDPEVHGFLPIRPTEEWIAQKAEE